MYNRLVSAVATGSGARATVVVIALKGCVGDITPTGRVLQVDGAGRAWRGRVQSVLVGVAATRGCCSTGVGVG